MKDILSFSPRPAVRMPKRGPNYVPRLHKGADTSQLTTPRATSALPRWLIQIMKGVDPR